MKGVIKNKKDKTIMQIFQEGDTDQVKGLLNLYEFYTIFPHI